MAASTAPTRASQPGARLAWRPLQRSTRVAIIGALVATLFYQLFLLNPAYRGPGWLWVAMLAAEGLTALHLIGTWWTILAHDDRPEPVDVTVWLGLVGVFLMGLGKNLTGNLIPTKDPTLPASLAHEVQ